MVALLATQSKSVSIKEKLFLHCYGSYIWILCSHTLITAQRSLLIHYIPACRHTRSFVRGQLRDMVKSFVTKLRPKLLTATQIIYLVNMVLVPRLEYRAMVTPLGSSDYNIITCSYHALLKNKSRIIVDALNAF